VKEDTMTKAKPRDPATLTDAHLPTMTEQEEALYYEANAHRLDELFDGDRPVEFAAEPKGVGLVVSVRMKADEADTLTKAARAAGKPLSTWLREVALEAASEHPKVHLDDLDDAAMTAVWNDAVATLAAAMRQVDVPTLRAFRHRQVTDGHWVTAEAGGGGASNLSPLLRSLSFARPVIDVHADAPAKGARPSR
jgi:uncharacterized protein (DUF1778 family)